MYEDNTGLMDFQFTNYDPSPSPTIMADTGWQYTTDATPVVGSDYWPDASSTTIASGSNSSPSSWNLGNFADNTLSGAKSFVDYGLKVGETALNAYGKLQGLELQNYIGKSQVDIAKMNAMTAQQTNALMGQAKVQMAQTAANAAKSSANLAALGQTPNSFMTYLTILGVVFAGIQIMRSAR